jgi:hypothetical protein
MGASAQNHNIFFKKNDIFFAMPDNQQIMSQPTFPTSPNMKSEGSESVSTDTPQYAQRVTTRRDSAISAVESAHAERTTLRELDKLSIEQTDTDKAFESFETLIQQLYKTEHLDSSYVIKDIFPGADHANALIKKVYGEKRTIISDANKYVILCSTRIDELKHQLELVGEKSDDFEEQLEEALGCLDETDVLLSDKDKQIGSLVSQINKMEYRGIPMAVFIVMYSYMFGLFGVSSVIYTHVWMIGMCFHTIGWSIQTSFQIGANSTEYVIDTGHDICSYFMQV